MITIYTCFLFRNYELEKQRKLYIQMFGFQSLPCACARACTYDVSGTMYVWIVGFLCLCVLVMP